MPTPKALVPAVILAGALALAGCGGGGGQNGGGGGQNLSVNVDGPPVSDVEAESVHLSDLLLSDPVEGDPRVSVNCRPGGFCSANFDGLFVVQFNVNDFEDMDTGPGDPDVSGSATLYNTYGDWSDTVAAAVHQREDGTTARYALAYGETHPNSLPLTGSATWRGDMAGLDANSRAVRGAAEITVADLSDPLADVTLTPRARRRCAGTAFRSSAASSRRNFAVTTTSGASSTDGAPGRPAACSRGTESSARSGRKGNDPIRDGGEDGLRIARFIQERKEPAMPMPITVSELRVSKKGKREHHRHRDDKL